MASIRPARPRCSTQSRLCATNERQETGKIHHAESKKEEDKIDERCDQEILPVACDHPGIFNDPEHAAEDHVRDRGKDEVPVKPESDIGHVIGGGHQAVDEIDTDDEDDSVFDLAEDLECEIEEAQERLEAIYDALSSITGCRPDEDEEWNEE